MGQTSDDATGSPAGRGLLTDSERAALAGDRSDTYRYKTRSQFRTRLDRVEEDVAHLARHDPDLLDELREVVCDEGDG